MVQSTKESYEMLMKKASSIIEKDKLLYKEKEKRGELFNFFSVLGVDTDELSHSAFLAELLNPLGTHGRGDVFLKSFLECIEIKTESFSNISVHVEKDIGLLNADKTEGGRIDIIIEFGKTYSIVIENKIRADDQEKQLIRYEKYLKQNFAKYTILYLTLDGHAPSEGSAEDVNNITCISYENHILKWLETCSYIAIQQPLIRESLIQYINLIKEFTGKTMSKETSSEIVKLLLKDGNIKIASEMSKELENARKHYLHGGDSGTDGIVALLKDLDLQGITFAPEAKFIDFNDKHFQYSWTFGTYNKTDCDYKLIFGFDKLTSNYSQIQLTLYLCTDVEEKRKLNEIVSGELNKISGDFKSDWSKIIWTTKLGGIRNIDDFIADNSEREKIQTYVKEMVIKIFQILESC